MYIKLNKRNIIILVAIMLVATLGFVVFGIEYDSVVRQKKELMSQLSSVQLQCSSLEQQNSSNGDKSDELNKKINDLNSQINNLNSQISSIKAMKLEIQKKNAETSSAADSKKQNSTMAAAALSQNLSNFSSANKGYKTCYLTFDDGPSDNTLKILDILKRGNATATFFVVNTAKTAYMKNIVAAGCAIGLHCYNHDFKNVYASDNAYFADLNKINVVVKNLVGIESKVIRFPGGSSNAVSKRYSKGLMARLVKSVPAKGYTFVDWNVDSGDASGNNVSAKKLVSNIKSGIKGKGDICILMHDASAKGTTVTALPEIISFLRSQGYKFEKLSSGCNAFHHKGLNN